MLTRIGPEKSTLGIILLALGMFASELVSSQNCDALVDYSYFDVTYGLNPNHEFHVGNDLTWQTNMNVHGEVIIEPGKTLIVDGATIHFGESANVGYRTTIVVRPGAHLVLQNNAVLTSLQECPGSMWEGVNVMGTSSASEASGLQGTLTMNQAMISNAYVGVYAGYCADPNEWQNYLPLYSGGIINCQDAWFLNNVYGVVLRSYVHPDNGGESATQFFRCTFATNAALNPCEGQLPEDCSTVPQVFLFVDSREHLRVGGCTFENDFGPGYSLDGTTWGSGIFAMNTSISILPLCDGVYPGLEPCDPQLRTINIFRGLFEGVHIFDWSPDKYAEVVRSSFSENIHGLFLKGVSHSTVIHNLVHVPLDPGNILSPRGISFMNSTGFDVQENELQGPPNNDFSQPNIGMWFINTGDAHNMFYKNQFHGPLTEGTIIQGDNDGPDPGDGLQFKCNNYGVNDVPNMYDIAFTGSQVSVGDKQGAGGNASMAAGNTFSPTCEANESAMWVQNGAINTFGYWHHNPAPPEKVYPDCRSNPPLADYWFTNTTFNFDDPSVCTSQTDLFTGDGGIVVLEAEQNHSLLKQVYDEQRDGGDTEGLKEFVGDVSHTSYDVRNRLMMVAPDVSAEVWGQVFDRDPAMNPWHLAQAMLANTPLEKEVITMMENSGLDPYYQQLVRGAQGTGISQLTIMEGEMGYWQNRREHALSAMAMEAIKTGTSAALHDALVWDEDHPQSGLPLNRLGLLMAAGDFTGAKDIVDNLLLAPEPDAGMEVLGMYLDLKTAGQTIYELGTSGHARLQDIANTSGPGQGQAQAWLESVGEGPFRDELILPNENRSLAVSATRVSAPMELLKTFPNPSDGKQPLHVVISLPEGIEQAALRILDPTGRLVRDEVISRAAAIVELAADDLISGIYMASLSVGKVQLGTSRFTVTR